jgi:hypothetical protein
MGVRKVVLRALIISISLGALLGIFAILGGHIGTTALKVMATSFSIAITSVLVLPSLAAWQLPVAYVWSRAGVCASLVALAMFNLGIWVEHDGDSYWQLTLTAIVIGTAGAHGALLSLARLAPRHHVVRVIALTNLVLLAVATCTAIWSHRPGEGTFKLLAILAILDVAFTLALGALDYVNRTNLVDPNMQEGDVAEVLFCPRCGRRLWYPAGEVRCGHCQARFFIELRKSEDLPTATAQEKKD